MKPFPFLKLTNCLLALSGLHATQPVHASEPDLPDTDSPPIELAPYVVTGAEPLSALESQLDPTQAAQPLPAQDGADVLKAIPGMSLIRKGGTDGDPVFRGMAGSRLGIQADGQICLGGCGARMDPPTAYIFPAAYDTVRLLKGPQTVLHGPGQSAGTVLFERASALDGADMASLRAQLTVGSWDRFDIAASALGRTHALASRLDLIRTKAGDYEDGTGQSVHSAHERWSLQPSLEYRMGPHSLLQLAAIRSDGEAAYADRMMDGSQFDRTSFSARFQHDRPGKVIRRMELEWGLNEIDHIMDNYRLRDFRPSMMMPNPSASNPDRRTVLARAKAELVAADGNKTFTIGVDHLNDRHRERSTMNATLMPLEAMPRSETARFQQVGLFGEAAIGLSAETRLVAGARLDDWSASDLRQTVRAGMMSAFPNPSANRTREERLASGFARIEKGTGSQMAFAGIGHVSRFPDYWELFRYEATESLSAHQTAVERTTQLDLGTVIQPHDDIRLTVSAFASIVDDFILIESGFLKSAGMMGQRLATVVRNVEARTHGAEAALKWTPTRHWTLEASLAHTHGENQTDGTALAQIPPLEGTLGLRWASETFSVGGHLRAAANQDRVAIGQGNIVGQDIGPSDGFSILSVHAVWRPASSLEIAAGIDNLFDQLYAEHLSRSGSSVAGFLQTARVNEPGRTLWLRVQMAF